MIRTFEPEDMDRVIAIWLEASVQAHGFVDREFWESKVHDMREVYLPLSETHVFEEEGVIQGFMSLHGDTIAAVFVEPDKQGKGIGTKLITRAKQLRKDLDLAVYKENQAAVSFYAGCGFEMVRERTDPHTGHPELLMLFRS